MTGMEYRQTQEQRTSLSQKMIQSSEILQMDVLGLERYIQQQASENPLIDLDEMERGLSAGEQQEDGGSEWEKNELKKKLEWLNQADEQNRIYYVGDYEEDDRQEPWDVSANEHDLSDYLMSQLIMQLPTERDYRCVEYLVYNLDSRGYLTEDVDALAEVLKIDSEEMERYLRLLWSAEPAGVGARNLGECMQIQIRCRMEDGLLGQQEFRDLMELAQLHMEALGKRHFGQIAAQMGIGVEKVLQYYEMIRGLNPIPGNSFSSREDLHYIKPDVTVVKFEHYFEVLVNDSSLPPVSANRYYLNMMNADSSVEVREYIQNKYRQVQWIQRCIKERNQTLKRVVLEIVRLQRQFFENPAGNRVPMSLRDLAQTLELHESTVSRAVKNKFLQCARGVFPVNYFFVKRIASVSEGEAYTPEQIKQRIREMIRGENRKKPLSDQKIADGLQRKRIAISRRTVAKYRAEMMIPDTVGRKNQFLAP